MVLSVIDSKILLKPLPQPTRPGRGKLPELRTRRGEVIAVGQGRPISPVNPTIRMPVQVAVGQVVYYDERGGQEVSSDEGTFVVIDELNVIAFETPVSPPTS